MELISLSYYFISSTKFSFEKLVQEDPSEKEERKAKK
jgi:hypothetical protein